MKGRELSTLVLTALVAGSGGYMINELTHPVIEIPPTDLEYNNTTLPRDTVNFTANWTFDGEDNCFHLYWAFNDVEMGGEGHNPFWNYNGTYSLEVPWFQPHWYNLDMTTEKAQDKIKENMTLNQMRFNIITHPTGNLTYSVIAY